ncbi:MAG: protein TolB [Deltaproteobacteria bacterium]|nr:MAG: protein TolB [Deltaproteobacteria bacterium]
MMIKKIITGLVLFSMFFATSVLYAEDRVYLDISSSKTKKIKFAVPWFVNGDMPGQPQKFGRELANDLANALKFHGIISVLPASEYGGKQAANLRAFDVDYSVLGSYKISGGSIRLEMRLMEVTSGQMLMGKSYQGKTGQHLSMLLKFCDKVIYELTGKNGIASTQVAFISSTKGAKELFLTDILGKKVRQVTRHKNLVVSPRFTPDGRYLSYTSYHSRKQNLYITDLRQNKTTTALSRRKGMNLAPAWSPDGGSFILTLSERGNPDLFLLDRTGRIINQLTSGAGNNVSPSYSPDGKKIVFVSDRSGKPQIYVMDIATRKTRRLTFDSYENSEPSWSPAEDLIVYSSLRDGVYQLCTIKPSADAMPNQITSDLSHHESASWSPDGNQIIFSRREGKSYKIYGMMKDGSYQRRLFDFPGSQRYPRWSYNYK